MRTRWDETWHRLREWTNGQGSSERLAAQVLLSEGYEDLDPSHPLGGRDGVRDAVCWKSGKKWVMAVFFPRGQQSFAIIKKKLLNDLRGVAMHGADGLVFVTNQELTLAERARLKEVARCFPIELYHLERVTMVLDQPHMASIRKQFLNIDFDPTVPEALEALVALGRDEREIREAIVGTGAAQRKLLERDVEPGKYRCAKCGSANVRTDSGVYNDRSVDVTACGDCGEHLGDCC